MSTFQFPTKAIFCALSCEAKPIIEALGLQKTSEVDYFPTFSKDKFLLVVTGMGGSAASAAVNFTLGRFPKITEIFNIGICGAKSEFQIGSLAIPSKILLDVTKSSLYPELLIGGSFHKGTIGTFLGPIRSAIDDIDFYDMECGHIFKESCRYICPSRILTIKVISDNLTELPKSKQEISGLIELQVEEIVELMDLQSSTIFKKEKLLSQDEESGLNMLSKEMRLTLTQQRQLFSVAQDHKIRVGDLSLLFKASKPEKQTTETRDKWLNDAIQILHRV